MHAEFQLYFYPLLCKRDWKEKKFLLLFWNFRYQTYLGWKDKISSKTELIEIMQALWMINNWEEKKNMVVLIQSLIKRRDRYVQNKRWAFHTILQKAAKNVFYLQY